MKHKELTSRYEKSFLKKIINLAKELECYTIEVNKLQDLAMMLDLAWTDTFVFTVHKFNRSNHGFVKKTGNGFIIEVIPF